MPNTEPGATVTQSSFEQKLSNASRPLDPCVEFAKLSGMALFREVKWILIGKVMSKQPFGPWMQ